MPFLIGLLIIFGGFVVGSFFAQGTMFVIAITFTAPGLIYEKLSRSKNVSKAVMFLIDLAVWSVVFGILYLRGQLTVLHVTVGIVVAFIIGIIGLFLYYFLDDIFNFESWEKKNCTRCGKIFLWTSKYWSSYCRTCREEYDATLASEIRKQPTTTQCFECNGSGRIKGYKCTKCKGLGSIARSIEDIKGAAQGKIPWRPN